jgi:hypothetical protein
VVIDKIALRVPWCTPYSPEFSKLYQEIRRDPKGPFRPSPHYLAAADLRTYGYPVLLHTHNTHDKVGNHKLEFLETGKLGYSQIRKQIHRIFNTDTGSLPIMRVDLAADIVGFTVGWFIQQLLVQYKRWTCDVGRIDAADAQISSMGKTGVETFYYGRRPNLVRIYNKIAERLGEYSRLKKRAWWEAKRKAMGGPVAFCFPDFETTFGYPEKGLILTRVERQIAGGRVPQVIGTFGRLRAAADFDPFEKLVFLNGGKPEPNPDDYDFDTYAKGMLIRALIQQEGIHRAKQKLNRLSTRNANRLLHNYKEFLPDDSARVTQKDLVEKYRQSVTVQLAA